MTWGTQNTQSDANAQIEYALDQGINFIDTAELYSVPPTPQSYGATESIIGNWLADNPGRRQEFVLATKIAGNGLAHIRDGGHITGDAIISSVDASLNRLKTDVIDLYQLHWPNRGSAHFGRHHPNAVAFGKMNIEAEKRTMLEVLQALDSCVKAGKLRHVGLSNESPWGVNEYLRLSQEHGLVRIDSIQNEFGLLQSKDWPHLIEQCVHEDIAYLPWSPLGGGILSGKYIDGARPEGSRWTMSQRQGLFRDSGPVNAATKRYLEIAKEFGMTSAQLALAWVDQVEGVTSTIIGATTQEQLTENIAAFAKPLSEEALAAVESVRKDYPSPF